MKQQFIMYFFCRLKMFHIVNFVFGCKGINYSYFMCIFVAQYYTKKYPDLVRNRKITYRFHSFVEKLHTF